jgi:hypothetical protein
MTKIEEIKLWRSTYVGTAPECEHGVFTDNSSGRVYAGKIAYGFGVAKRCACVGVVTQTNGTTWFVECDADGRSHGYKLDCWADGHAGYYRYEHGSQEEYAILDADGTCYYNNQVCRADYAPFVSLQAKVLAIKARPH